MNFLKDKKVWIAAAVILVIIAIVAFAVRGNNGAGTSSVGKIEFQEAKPTVEFKEKPTADQIARQMLADMAPNQAIITYVGNMQYSTDTKEEFEKYKACQESWCIFSSSSDEGKHTQAEIFKMTDNTQSFDKAVYIKIDAYENETVQKEKTASESKRLESYLAKAKNKDKMFLDAKGAFTITNYRNYTDVYTNTTAFQKYFSELKVKS